MTSDSTQAGLQAWGGLLRVHASVVPLLDRALQDAAGLPLSWYDVLLEINSAPDRRLSMSELGARVTLSRTRVSRLVDELERVGYVTRQAHPTDGRSTYTTLTAAGRRRFKAAVPVYVRGIHEHFIARLKPAELQTIAVALGRVAASAGQPEAHFDA